MVLFAANCLSHKASTVLLLFFIRFVLGVMAVRFGFEL